jgi:tetratricopeptide (TPR) repeat protein
MDPVSGSFVRFHYTAGMQPYDDDASVRHLIELGYIDPYEVAAREEAVRQHQQVELRSASEMAAQGRMSDAVALLERLSADDPDWIAPRQAMADVYFREGRYREAQSQLDWLTYHGVENPRLSLIGGALALSRRELQSAVEALEYARYVEPELPSVQTLYGSVMLRLSRLDEAEHAFQEAVKQSSVDARALDGLAAVCLRRRRFEEAADWALQSIEQNARIFRAHYHLGLALAGLNRPSEAMQALEMSAKVDSLRSAPYYWLAQIAQNQRGDAALAEHYRQLGRLVVQRRRSSPRRR